MEDNPIKLTETLNDHLKIKESIEQLKSKYKSNQCKKNNSHLISGLFDIIDFEFSFFEQITQAYHSLCDSLYCRDMVIENLVQANIELFERKIDSFIKQISRGLQWTKNKNITIHKEIEFNYKSKALYNHNHMQIKGTQAQLPKKRYIASNNIITKLQKKQGNSNKLSKCNSQLHISNNNNQLHPMQKPTFYPISLSLNNSYCDIANLLKNRIMNIGYGVGGGAEVRGRNLTNATTTGVTAGMSISMDDKRRHNNTMTTDMNYRQHHQQKHHNHMSMDQSNGHLMNYATIEHRRYETLHIEVKLLKKFRTILNKYNKQPTEAENKRKYHLMNKKYLIMQSKKKKQKKELNESLPHNIY